MARLDTVLTRIAQSGSRTLVFDLTPNSLTATGAGPWVLHRGVPGFIEVVLTGTTPTATVQIEATNTQDPTTPAVLQVLDAMSGDKTAVGMALFTGPVWIRVNVTALSGTGATVNATVAWS